MLQDVARYYEETIDWEPTLHRNHIEAFLNHLAAQGMAEKPFQVWIDPRVLEVLLREVYEDGVEKARQWFYEEKVVRDGVW